MKQPPDREPKKPKADPKRAEKGRPEQRSAPHRVYPGAAWARTCEEGKEGER